MAHAGEEFAFQFCGVLHLAVAQFKLFVRGREHAEAVADAVDGRIDPLGVHLAHELVAFDRIFRLR